MEDKDKKPSFLGGALLGGIIGAASYFLFGTKEGKKTQKKITKEGKEAYEKAKPTLEKLGEEGKKLAKNVKPTIEKLGEEGKELLGKAQKEVKKLDKKTPKSKAKK